MSGMQLRNYINVIARPSHASADGHGEFGRCGSAASADRSSLAAGDTIVSDMATLADVLVQETREGELYETLPDGRLRCYACGHCCPLPDGAVGVCKVRFNAGGKLFVPWGYVGGVQCDP